MAGENSFSLVRPTKNTPYHIDFDWWKNHDNDWRVFLFSCLCPEHQAAFNNLPMDMMVDWIDPETAVIHQVDALQSTLMDHCARQENFLTLNTAMVDAIFRIFLSNGNSSLNALELSDKIGKPADTILRLLSGITVYRGIRPCH
jgi:hypothetical protein